MWTSQVYGHHDKMARTKKFIIDSVDAYVVLVQQYSKPSF